VTNEYLFSHRQLVHDQYLEKLCECHVMYAITDGYSYSLLNYIVLIWTFIDAMYYLHLCSCIALLLLVMDAVRRRFGHYIFVPWFLLLLLLLLFSSPILSRRSSANLGCRSEMCCTRLAENCRTH